MERRSLGEPYFSRLKEVAAGLGGTGASQRIPRAVSRPASVTAATLLLAGMIDRWWLVPLVVGVLFAILWVRDRMSTVEGLTRIPVVYRFLVGLAVGFLVIRGALSQVEAFGRVIEQSFAIPLMAVLVAIAFMALLTAPARPEEATS